MALACGILGVTGAAQRVMSNLPATPPTSAAQVGPISATAVQPDAATKARRAEVTYASGLISVNANNSSLNQILREIARQTGMKITGGVHEERVFGHYGPATPEVILLTLIDGNSTNMLLRQTATNQPRELILTPRNGGPTPPNPNAGGFDDEEQPQQQQEQRNDVVGQPVQVPPGPMLGAPRTVPAPANNVLGNPNNVTPTASTLPVTNSVPTDSLPTPSTTTQTIPGIVDTPNPPDAGTVNPVTGTPASGTPATGTPAADTPATPEDIYNQLLKLRQQQKKTTPPQ